MLANPAGLNAAQIPRWDLQYPGPHRINMALRPTAPAQGSGPGATAAPGTVGAALTQEESEDQDIHGQPRALPVGHRDGAAAWGSTAWASRSPTHASPVSQPCPQPHGCIPTPHPAVREHPSLPPCPALLLVSIGSKHWTRTPGDKSQQGWSRPGKDVLQLAGVLLLNLGFCCALFSAVTASFQPCNHRIKA